MNFYRHHLGDFNSHTLHLDWLEDLAYSRLLRTYYLTERPIPIDLEEACRLVRATSKPQRDAVERVLQEFFYKQEDGWHNRRCDREILAYREKVQTNRKITQLRTVGKGPNGPQTSC